MGTVLLHQEAVLVCVVVQIAADVVPALPDLHLSSPLRQLPGDYRSGQAAANHQILHCVCSISLK